MSIYSGIQKKADTMAVNAKDGTLKFNNEIFTFKYNIYQSVYEVFDSENNIIFRFNTKKISEAKKWFKNQYER